MPVKVDVGAYAKERIYSGIPVVPRWGRAWGSHIGYYILVSSEKVILLSLNLA
jgi:hypothetical protein